MRRNARRIQVGKVTIGGNAPIAVQSMAKTLTADIDATVAQILQLERAGCDIARIAIPDESAAHSLALIKHRINIPLVADIHFNHRLAILAIEAGADKIRINPGNIGSEYKIKAVLEKAKDRDIPIRIGVNAGSLEKDLVKRYGQLCAEALVESAMRHIKIYEAFSFENLVVSLKASDVNMMIDAYRVIARKIDYPLHLGLTAAGTEPLGLIKSAIGIGTLLKEGIGDTIRVSLSADPEKEVEAGIAILQALNLRHHGINIVSCPTCGRTEFDLLKMVGEVESNVSQWDKSLTVAIMGCTVNGPGEAREADLGVACSRNQAILFKKGKIYKKIGKQEIVKELLNEIYNY